MLWLRLWFVYIGVQHFEVCMANIRVFDGGISSATTMDKLNVVLEDRHTPTKQRDSCDPRRKGPVTKCRWRRLCCPPVHSPSRRLIRDPFPSYIIRNDKAYHKFVVGDFNARIGKANESEYRIGNFGLGERNEDGNYLAGLLSAARLFHGNSFFQKKESRRWTWESPNGMAHAEIDHILTNRRWCLLDTSTVSSFYTGSEHRLLRAKIRLSRKLEKNSLHRPRRKSLAVYDENILNETLRKRDWLIKGDPTEDYELLVEGLKSCAELASVPHARSDRISITTKELLEKRRKLRLDPTATQSCLAIEQALEAVETMRKSYLPRLTDCTTIGEHSNAPYYHRMIAVDEISLEIDTELCAFFEAAGLINFHVITLQETKSGKTDIQPLDVQLARIDPQLARNAGESTLAYLTRVRHKMPSLPVPLIQRIAYMHEAARFRPQKFELKHLMELRSLLNQFVKIIGDAPVVDAATPASPAKGILHHLGQKALVNKKRRSNFGGSDGEARTFFQVAGSDRVVAMMSFAGPRDPMRNRRYYEDRHVLSSEHSVATARLKNVNDSTFISPSRSISGGENGVSTTQKAAPMSDSTSRRLPVRVSITNASPTRSSGGAAGDFGSLMKTTWNDIKELLGFIPPCHNGGTRKVGAACECPKLFEGNLCEKRICLNGGKLERAKYGPVSWDCKCPTPQYIEGAHCETVRCGNNAHLRTEEFTAPYAVFAIPLACLLLFALCIAVCQMDLCPRRRSSRHRLSDSVQGNSAPRSRRRTATCTQTRPRGNPAAGQRTAVTQISGVDPMSTVKPLDPPPSYEQAISAVPVPQPPSYTEAAHECSPPPPPPRQPPLPPPS
ncbi:unnamed protein product [Angiostrongylus costaricensis]|uniref:EGF-like domain-containing protein n=1 Tax=Angiostrongylus costaricensis TaxID=334426 RepID=A0A158PM09_ANGCS|nr:unnamed protein product [Angiostrongylus costaricensis]